MEFGTYRYCPVCGGAYRIASRNVARCKECEHTFKVAPPSAERIRKFWQGAIIFKWTHGGRSLNDIGNRSLWNDWIEGRISSLEWNLGEEGLRPPLRIAEVGCLDGIVLAELSSRGHTVMGCDLNQEVISHARQALNTDLRVGTVSQCMPFWGSFDLVLALHVLPNCRCPLEELASWVRLLAPGGRLLLDLALNRQDFKIPDIIQYFNEHSARTLMETFFPRVDFRLHPEPALHKEIGTFVGYL